MKIDECAYKARPSEIQLKTWIVMVAGEDVEGWMVVDSTHSHFNTSLWVPPTNRSEVLVPFRDKSILITNIAGFALLCENLRTEPEGCGAARHRFFRLDHVVICRKTPFEATFPR
jgi:hypothetical protein